MVLTHAHADHLGAAADAAGHFHIPLWVHEADEKMLRSPASREMAAMFGIEPCRRRPNVCWPTARPSAVGDLELKVIHSPGHSPGSILLHGDGLLFTGDTLFQGDVGRTDLPGGDEEELRASLDRIREFPPATVILPGHGPASILERELPTTPISDMAGPAPLAFTPGSFSALHGI